MVLANTYHLSLRPGEETVAALGGLHRLMGWDGPILTDSGGFQLFSLARLIEVSEEQATFRSHIDGRLVAISPERAVAIQEALGATWRWCSTTWWACPTSRRSCATRWSGGPLGPPLPRAARRTDQALFGIVQGGLDVAMRVAVPRQLRELDFAGYAVGGLSVGEPVAEMLRILDAIVPELPADRPRYLMGVGRPQDLLESVPAGSTCSIASCRLERAERLGVHRRRTDPAAQRPIQRDRGRSARLPLRRLPPQPRLRPPSIHGPRNARPDPALDPQSDLLSASPCRPASDRGRPLPCLPRGKAAALGGSSVG